jgi:hypothetical protein
VNLEPYRTSNSSGTVGIHRYVLSEPEKRLRVLELSVQLLIARAKTSDFWADGFHDTAKLLEAVPLTTLEFDSARLHLQNAFAFSQHREFGAATFELRIVRGILQRL